MNIKNHQKINIIIDIAMFVLMLLLIAVGVLIRYALISGAERWVKYGKNVELTVGGMDRHEWGLIHLIIGILLIVLLIFHLVFHWSQMISMLKRLLPNTSVRVTVISSLLIIGVFIIASPILLPPKIGETISGYNNSLRHSDGYHETKEHSHAQENIAENHSLHKNEENKLNIRGYNTLSEIAGQYNVPVEKLKAQLQIPGSISNNEKLGQLRRSYKFTMGDVENAVLKLQKN